jgi:hypothetical protein
MYWYSLKEEGQQFSSKFYCKNNMIESHTWFQFPPQIQVITLRAEHRAVSRNSWPFLVVLSLGMAHSIKLRLLINNNDN